MAQTNTERIMEHIDKMVKPLITRLDQVYNAVFGNGKRGLNTRQDLTEQTIENIKADIEEIKKQVGEIRSGLLFGGIFIVVLQIVLKFI